MSDLRRTASAVSVLLTPQRESGAVGGGGDLDDGASEAPVSTEPGEGAWDPKFHQEETGAQEPETARLLPLGWTCLPFSQ